MFAIPEDWMMGIDIAVIVLYIVFLIRGAKKGFLLQILSTFGTLFAFVASWRYCGLASKYYHLWPASLNPVKDMPGISDAVYAYLNMIVWFIAMFLIIRLVFAVIEKLTEGISDLPVIREVSGLAGAAFGAVAATVWILVATTVLRTPIISNGGEVANNTLLGTVSDVTGSVLGELAGPVKTSEVFQKLYTDAQNLDDRDKQYIENWLNEHGLEPAEQSGMRIEELRRLVPGAGAEE